MGQMGMTITGMPFEFSLSRRALGGGSVIVWACLDFFGRSKIIVIDGSITSLKYQKILKDHMLPLFRFRAGQYFIFKQDCCESTSI